MSAIENASAASNASLSDLEIRILDFERSWWRYAGAKERDRKSTRLNSSHT